MGTIKSALRFSLGVLSYSSSGLLILIALSWARCRLQSQNDFGHVSRALQMLELLPLARPFQDGMTSSPAYGSNALFYYNLTLMSQTSHGLLAYESTKGLGHGQSSHGPTLLLLCTRSVSVVAESQSTRLPPCHEAELLSRSLPSSWLWPTSRTKVAGPVTLARILILNFRREPSSILFITPKIYVPQPQPPLLINYVDCFFQQRNLLQTFQTLLLLQ
jgi:hypothetical protein